MAYTYLGRIRPVYKGTWSNTTAYTALEMVKSTNGRAAYIALKDVPMGTPLTNADYWAAVLDVSDVLTAADAAIQAANEAAHNSAAPLKATVTKQPASVWADEGSPLQLKLGGAASAKVYRSGKNILDTTALTPQNGTTVTRITDGVVITTTNAAFGQAKSGSVRLLKGVTYAFSFKVTAFNAGSVIVRLRDASNNIITGASVSVTATGEKTLVFTPGADTDAHLIVITTTETPASAGITLQQIQLEVGSAKTAYEAYRGGVFMVSSANNTVPALDGLNVVFCDAASLEVTYNRSHVREHEEIMRRLAALEAAIT